MKYEELDLSPFLDNVIIVEGKKDVSSLKALGFQKVYSLHEHSASIRERIEQITSSLSKSENIIVLTDNDFRGRKLRSAIKPILQELGLKINNTLPRLIRKAGLSHIEGLHQFMNKNESRQDKTSRHL